MQNPFESGHIKNYILLYVSVVVIMVLFFIAATLFRSTEIIDMKIFNTEIDETKRVKDRTVDEVKNNEPTKFKLLDKAY